MKVVCHLARREEVPVPTLCCQAFEGRPAEAVGVVAVDIHTVDPARGDVEDTNIGENTAGKSCHRPNVSAPSSSRNPHFGPRPKTPCPGDCPRAMARSVSGTAPPATPQRRSGHGRGTVPETCSKGACPDFPCPGDSPYDMCRADMAWGLSPRHVVNGGGGVRARRRNSRPRRRRGRACRAARRRPFGSRGTPRCSD